MPTFNNIAYSEVEFYFTKTSRLGATTLFAKVDWNRVNLPTICKYNMILFKIACKCRLRKFLILF